MSKIFNIYLIETENDTKNLSEDKQVESGLSSGELRQSLIERLNEELEKDNISVVNNCLLQFDITLNEKKTRKNIDKAKKDVENLLYCITDENINKTFWKFPEELLYVKLEKSS